MKSKERCTRDLKKGRGNKMRKRGVKVFSRGRKYRENFEKIFGKLLYAEVGEKECTPHGACEACKCEKGRRLLLSGDIPLNGAAVRTD